MGILIFITITWFSDWEGISKQVRKKHLVSGAEKSDDIENSELKERLINN